MITGVGSPIAGTRVDGHGGTVSASNPAGGACFTVALPAAAGEGAAR